MAVVINKEDRFMFLLVIIVLIVSLITLIVLFGIVWSFISQPLQFVLNEISLFLSKNRVLDYNFPLIID